MVEHAHVVSVSSLYGGVEWDLLHKRDVVALRITYGRDAVGVFLGVKRMFHILYALQPGDLRNDGARLLEELSSRAHLRALLLRLSGTSKVAELAALAPFGVHSFAAEKNVQAVVLGVNAVWND